MSYTGDHAQYCFLSTGWSISRGNTGDKDHVCVPECVCQCYVVLNWIYFELWSVLYDKVSTVYTELCPHTQRYAAHWTLVYSVYPEHGSRQVLPINPSVAQMYLVDLFFSWMTQYVDMLKSHILNIEFNVSLCWNNHDKTRKTKYLEFSFSLHNKLYE